MALAGRHLVLGAVAGCAVAGLVLLPPRAEPAPQRGFAGAESQMFRRLARAYRRTEETLSLITLRDSLMSQVEAHPERRVFIDERLRPWKSALDSMLEAGWWHEAARSGVRTFVAFRASEIYSRDKHFIVPKDEAEPCGVVIGVRHERPHTWTPASLSSLIEEPGPCAFFVDFGHPGSAIAQWLSHRNYEPTFQSQGTPISSAPRRAMDVRRFSSDVTPRLTLCAKGSLSACREIVLSPPRHRVGVEGIAGWWPYWYWTYGNPGGQEALGYASRHFLGDLLADRGSEAFGAFWKADGDIATAFVTAFGIPIEVWTRDWVHARYGTPKPSQLGSRAVLFSLVICGLAVGVTAVGATRRRQLA